MLPATVLCLLLVLAIPSLATATLVYNFTTLDFFPGGINNSGQIVPRGEAINNRGDVVTPGMFRGDGFITVIDPELHASFDVMRNRFTAAGINDRGEIVGWFVGNDEIYPPMVLLGPRPFLFSDDTFTLLIDARATAVALGINNDDVIVGWVGGDPVTHTRALVLGDPHRGGFQAPPCTPDRFGDARTEAHGINNRGDIVGRFVCNDQVGGFLLIADEFSTSINPPGGLTLSLDGINDRGQIVGMFVDPNGHHGFLATPVPQPLTIILMAAGVVPPFAWRLWRQRRVAR